MKKIYKVLGLGLIALALVVGVGAGSASAALTLADLAVTSDGALTITGSAAGVITLGSMTYTPATSPTRDVFVMGTSGNNATLRVFSDNLTALAIQGLSSANDAAPSAAVNGFSGIFTSTAYSPNGTSGNANGNGTVQTRFVVGSGSDELDLDLSSPNAILVRATDPTNINTASAGVVKVQSLTNIQFHARSKSDLVSPNYLSVDRVNQGVDDANIGTNNTSEVTLGTNSGALLLNYNSTTGGVVFPSMTDAERDATTPVAGEVIYNETTNLLNVYNGTSWFALDQTGV